MRLRVQTLWALCAMVALSVDSPYLALLHLWPTARAAAQRTAQNDDPQTQRSASLTNVPAECLSELSDATARQSGAYKQLSSAYNSGELRLY